MIVAEVQSAEWAEFRQRYLHTLGFLKASSGKKLPVEITGVWNDHTEVQDVKGNKYHLVSDSGVTLEFTQVLSKWYQPDSRHIFYTCRNAERMWKRGMSSDNTQIYQPIGKTVVMITANFERLAQLWEPDPDASCFDAIKGGNCGVWSKDFAYNDGQVFVRNIHIGTVDHLKNRIEVHPMFLQELQDAIKRRGLEYSIKEING